MSKAKIKTEPADCFNSENGKKPEPGGKLRLTIVTPEKTALETQVDFVALPGYDGEMGVLSRHIPYVVKLNAGVLRYKSGQSAGEFAIMGGFAEILKDDVTVLAEDAQLAEAMNEEAARQSLQKAKDALMARGKDMSLEEAESEVVNAQIRFKLASRVQMHLKKKKQ